MNGVFFLGASRAAMAHLTEVVDKLISQTSRLLPKPWCKHCISHHIMQQALKQEAACFGMGRKGRRQERDEDEEKRGGMTGRAIDTTAIILQTIMPLSADWEEQEWQMFGVRLCEIKKWTMIFKDGGRCWHSCGLLAVSRCHKLFHLIIYFLPLSVHAFWAHLLDRTWGRHLTLQPSHKSTQGWHQHTGDNTEHR